MILWAIVFTAALFRQQGVPISGGHDKSAIFSEVRAGRYSEARQMLAAALKQSPQDAALWTLNGVVLAHLSQPQEALLSFKHAIQLSPDYLPALEGAAQIEYQAGDQSAVVLLNKIVALHPEDETSHAMLATLAFERHDCKQAVKEFAQSPQLRSSTQSSLKQYGSCLLQTGEAGNAVPVFAKLSERDPQNDKARYNLALAQVLAKQYREAIATLAPLVESPSPDAAALDVLAQAYEGVLETPNAVAALRQAIVSQPNVAQYYLDFANICLVHGSYLVGVDMLNSGLKRLPDSAPLYLARGILYIQLDKFEDARRDFEQSEQLDPELSYGHGLQGLADLQLNHLATAENDIRGRLKKTPNDAFLWFLLGETIMRAGAAAGSAPFQEALRCAEKAVALRPDFALARNQLARLYFDQGRMDDSIQQSRKALRLDPTGQSAATALYHLILALRKQGKRDEIAPLAKQLVELQERARAKETAEHSFSLVEVSPEKH